MILKVLGKSVVFKSLMIRNVWHVAALRASQTPQHILQLFICFLQFPPPLRPHMPKHSIG